MKIGKFISGGALRKFISESMQGTDEKPSSKKVTAFALTALVMVIVFTILFISYLATFRQVTLSDNVLELLKFIGGTVLMYLLIATLALFGVQGWQQLGSLKIMNPAPPVKKETTVNVEGAEPTINVDEAVIKSEK